MNLSETELEVVTDLAGLFYSPREVAIVLEINVEDFVTAVDAGCGSIYRAYMKGYFKGDIELRRSVMESALHGSSPAQAMLREIQKMGKVAG